MMRAAAINFKLESVHCPFCRSHTEKPSSLIVCSECKTYYHRECWLQNQGCSVFGCAGIMNELGTRNGEPRWLIGSRILVFGFMLCSAIAPFIQSIFLDVLLIVWTILFMLVAPVQFIIEVVCLWLVYGQPQLSPRYGRLVHHVISLSGYVITISLLFAIKFVFPFRG